MTLPCPRVRPDERFVAAIALSSAERAILPQTRGRSDHRRITVRSFCSASRRASGAQKRPGLRAALARRPRPGQLRVRALQVEQSRPRPSTHRLAANSGAGRGRGRAACQVP